MADNAVVKQKMNPQQRIAVLLASLDADVAAKVMQELAPEVMSRTVEEIRRLGMVTGNVRQQAISESLDEISAFHSAVFGGDGVAVGLLGKVVGEQRAVSMLDLGNMAGSRFGSLAIRRPQEIAALLQKEPVSVVSMVMRHLPSDLSAQTLSLFEDERRSRIVLQMATATLPSEEVIDQVEKQLTARLAASSDSGNDDESRLNAVVSILQRSPKEISEALLAEFEKKDPDLASQLRDQMFVFDDIVRLNDASIRRILQDLENGVLSIALRKASDDVKNRFFSNMSRRAVEGLEEEMSYAGKMPFSEVMAKQKMIVDLARKLAAEGEIQLNVQEEEYV